MPEAGAAFARAHSEVVETGQERGGAPFGRGLVLAAVAVTVALGYESLAQSHAPSLSVLALVHGLGYMRDYQVAYDPGKGLWLLLGWAGTAMMVAMMAYSLRKRLPLLSSALSMSGWLNFHMLMGVVGPLFITFHTTFKFNGLVGTSYWAMVAVVAFGALGRYIYVQIPRGITGVELGIREIESSVADLDRKLALSITNARILGLLRDLGAPEPRRIMGNLALERKEAPESTALRELLDGISRPDDSPPGMGPLRSLLFVMRADAANRLRTWGLERTLAREYGLGRAASSRAASLISAKAALIRKRNFLSTSHRLLRYWHVLHIPLAVVMFAILFVHIIVYYVFRAT